MNQNILEGIGKVLEGIEKLCRLDPDSFPPCHAKPLRGKRGIPFSKMIIVHYKHDGTYQMTPVEPDKVTKDTSEEEPSLTAEEFEMTLQKVSRRLMPDEESSET